MVVGGHRQCNKDGRKDSTEWCVFQVHTKHSNYITNYFGNIRSDDDAWCANDLLSMSLTSVGVG